MAVLRRIKATYVAKKIAQILHLVMGGFHLFERSQELASNTIEIGDEDEDEARRLINELAEGDSLLVTTTNEKADVLEDFGHPIHPLDGFDVFRLIKTRKIRLPTSAELQDKCKSDGLAKLLVIAQTLWFIVQCIAWKASKHPLTELEVISLDYTLLTVAMYIAWWDKPCRVTFPVRVYEPLPDVRPSKRS
ncbi:SubName: Full=Uncharacterized protein {ECO:0000313/EMBL:CCA76703.1} [Serendipita indica DSM 11827]|uniref:Uncharacterized protein n=1 Tax=Serendipita indica (strain DSM 11827) TaxID=1109443 RepID=G4TZG0_SERID|nr:SubName: Full=Uncharacterized protein {ECO:0000313/EMBL:CCA76703.1} [Serendipita indica DSM 11827]CCA76703.1 hypothetical protein PIIN_10691 [Serendipita indica DSM 11827]